MMNQMFDRIFGTLVAQCGLILITVTLSALGGCNGGEAPASSDVQASTPQVMLTVTLTQEASQAIARIMREQKLEGGYYVRVGTTANNPDSENDYRGYVLDLTVNLKPGDVWADSEGFRLIAQPADAEALRGFVIDYTELGKIAGFVFMEP